MRDINPWRRRVVMAAALVSICCMLFGWRERIGRRWIARADISFRKPTNAFYGPYLYGLEAVPVPLSSRQSEQVLSDYVRKASSGHQKLDLLKLLVGNGGRHALPDLQSMAAKEPDPALLEWELRLIGLCRDPSSANFLADHLKDSDPGVRAAAVDALSILRHPSYSILAANTFYICEPLSLDTQPPVNLREVLLPSDPSNSRTRFWDDRSRDLVDAAPIDINTSLHSRFLKLMTDGTSEQVREAAARAIVDWPPVGYQFRFAEWGVWIDSRGHLALAKSIIDEIPAFVHRTGNPVSSFGEYFLYPSIVTKPIIHLTSSVPLAADVEVRIREGRP